MDETGMKFIIYGYVLPLLIMLIWVMWRVYSELEAGERFVSHFLRDCWPLLIPGISLWGVCSLLLLAIIEGNNWLVRHCKPWRMAGEHLSRVEHRIFDEDKEE